MTVSVHKHLRSATIELPEAAPMIGKDVRIIVVEEAEPRAPRNLEALDSIAGKTVLDYDAIENLRSRSVM